jgi:hypothetical protein
VTAATAAGEIKPLEKNRESSGSHCDTFHVLARERRPINQRGESLLSIRGRTGAKRKFGRCSFQPPTERNPFFNHPPPTQLGRGYQSLRMSLQDIGIFPALRSGLWFPRVSNG